MDFDFELDRTGKIKLYYEGQTKSDERQRHLIDLTNYSVRDELTSTVHKLVQKQVGRQHRFGYICHHQNIRTYSRRVSAIIQRLKIKFVQNINSFDQCLPIRNPNWKTFQPFIQNALIDSFKWMMIPLDDDLPLYAPYLLDTNNLSMVYIQYGISKIPWIFIARHQTESPDQIIYVYFKAYCVVDQVGTENIKGKIIYSHCANKLFELVMDQKLKKRLCDQQLLQHNKRNIV